MYTTEKILGHAEQFYVPLIEDHDISPKMSTFLCFWTFAFRITNDELPEPDPVGPLLPGSGVQLQLLLRQRHLFQDPLGPLLLKGCVNRQGFLLQPDLTFNNYKFALQPVCVKIQPYVDVIGVELFF